MVTNEDGQQCWAMSSDKYCAAAVANVEETLAKKGQKLPSKCDGEWLWSRAWCDCCENQGSTLTESAILELKADGIQWFH